MVVKFKKNNYDIILVNSKIKEYEEKLKQRMNLINITNLIMPQVIEAPNNNALKLKHHIRVHY